MLCALYMRCALHVAALCGWQPSTAAGLAGWLASSRSASGRRWASQPHARLCPAPPCPASYSPPGISPQAQPRTCKLALQSLSSNHLPHLKPPSPALQLQILALVLIPTLLPSPEISPEITPEISPSPEIRWSLQRGFVPLPKSVSPERQRENFAVFDFCIPEAEMRELDALEAHLITG